MQSTPEATDSFVAAKELKVTIQKPSGQFNQKKDRKMVPNRAFMGGSQQIAGMSTKVVFDLLSKPLAGVGKYPQVLGNPHHGFGNWPRI